MSKRLLDKKAVKISFNDFPDDPEFNCNWDVNFSSDEDIFLKGKSEILWSRPGDLFDSFDSCQSFSNITERTLSSCSWHNDEFDMKSSWKVNASLEAIDDALYEKVKSPSLNDVLFQECSDWSEKFPYFRIKGQQIVSSENKSFLPVSSSSINIKEFGARTSSSSLHLEGKRLPIHSASKTRGLTENNLIQNNLEEIIDDDNAYEEFFALHKSDESCDNIQVPLNDDSNVHSTFKSMQEKILDKLVSEMWPSILAFLENIDDKSTNNVNSDLQLPPITGACVPQTSLCLKRPNTEGSNVIITAFPKLDSILTVSPKILQKREHGSINRATRPNSEMSVNTRLSSKPLKSVYLHSNYAEISSEFSQNNCSKKYRESDSLSFVLPALEEDFHDSSSVLRGFHIEPHSKNLANKTAHPSRNEALSRESDSFLPPIADRNYLPSDIKLTKNLFTFYGSSVRENKYSSSAKYKKNSRPNTSVSKKSIKNCEVSQHLPVNSELYITAKGVSKTLSNLHIETSSDVNTDNDETQEESQEKSVTLFPIVKSLTPHEDKNNSVKGGILHTFLRGRKR